MKQYIIDELRPQDYQKIKEYFDKNLGMPKINSIYWVELSDYLLNDIQISHPECKPFYFAIELGQKQISCELLIRSQNKIRCNCINYADERQRNWVINFIDTIFNDLNIII
ncbi:MAG: hypothetical protein HQK79_02695 [Desulfobacterales bacterium]|nr:hypothetical protein [Desulfobacterales bacterium]MBF0395516.1 hypothetical protein [Desulfobacterales bacterium]